MTTQEHINELVLQAESDFGAADALAQTGYYTQSLFYRYSAFEKLCKALCIKKKTANEYPISHNLNTLLSDNDIELSQTQKKFYSDMNLYYTKGRYPNAPYSIENTFSKDFYNGYFEQTKAQIHWLKTLITQ